jgi:hypothetical protein
MIATRSLTDAERERASDPGLLEVADRTARTYSRRWGLDLDDCLSDAMLAVMRAVCQLGPEDLDPAPYVAAFVKMAIFRRLFSRSQYSPLSMDAIDPDGYTLHDVIASPPPGPPPPDGIRLETMSGRQLATLYRAIEVNRPGAAERLSRHLDIPPDDAAELLREGGHRLASYRRIHPEARPDRWLIPGQVLTRLLG